MVEKPAIEAKPNPTVVKNSLRDTSFCRRTAIGFLFIFCFLFLLSGSDYMRVIDFCQAYAFAAVRAIHDIMVIVI